MCRGGERGERTGKGIKGETLLAVYRTPSTMDELMFESERLFEMIVDWS